MMPAAALVIVQMLTMISRINRMSHQTKIITLTIASAIRQRNVQSTLIEIIIIVILIVITIAEGIISTSPRKKRVSV